MLVRDVAIGEHHEINPLSREQALQVRLGHDLDPIRIEWAGQLSRVTTAGDAGDLSCGREGHNFDSGVGAVDNVEVMEVAPSGPHDHNTNTIHGDSGLPQSRRRSIPAANFGLTSRFRSGPAVV